MKAYLSLFGARFKTLIQYRAAAVAGFGTQLFWGLIRVMILEAFFRNSTAAQPMTLSETITYIWLGQAFFAMMPFSANPDPEVRNMIRTGSVAYELARPLDLWGLWYARAVAARSAPTLLRAVPMFLAAVPFFGMALPPSAWSALAWALSMAGALLLVSAFSTVITISLLWTISSDGITRIMPALVLLGSGLVLPLPLFPESFQAVLRALPFSAMADEPFRLYMGHLPPEAAPAVLLKQALWTAAFALAGRFLMARGARRLVVQGG